MSKFALMVVSYSIFRLVVSWKKKQKRNGYDKRYRYVYKRLHNDDDNQN